MSNVMLKLISISSTNDTEIYYFQILYRHSKDFMFLVAFEYESQSFVALQTVIMKVLYKWEVLY